MTDLGRHVAPEGRRLDEPPEDGPFLLVSNHAAGLRMPDARALANALFEQHRHGVAHHDLSAPGDPFGVVCATDHDVASTMSCRQRWDVRGGAMGTKPVVVVGAGLAGLSATYTLRRKGMDVVAFEASPYAGGRCRTIHEDGYEFIAGAGSTEPQWTTTFQYLRELGLEDRIYSIARQRYGFLRDGRVRTVVVEPSVSGMLRALPENLRFLRDGPPLRTWWQVAKLSRALRRQMKLVDAEHQDFAALTSISDTSTADFVRTHGGPEALEWVFHPFLSTMVLGRPSEISVVHPISLFSLMTGMCSMRGGLGAISAALHERVADRVHLSTPVEEIVIEDNRVVGVRTAQGFVEADRVICAVDAVTALQLMPGLPDSIRLPLQTCRYSSTWYYQFGLERPLDLPQDTPWYVVMTPASADTILSFASLGSMDRAHPVVIAATRGWEDERLGALSDEERRRLVIDELQRIEPSFPSEPRITKVFRWDRAVNLESPGQFAAIQQLLAHDARDVAGLYLAGEYLFLIASTEGALRTGKTAAEQVAEELRLARR
ncbi:MAG: FAD-dependent oxidoreductase [Acidimicrobiales bacterium]|nr:FAD-dependent oxidoreductase [Acidimicrobiales bacterium]